MDESKSPPPEMDILEEWELLLPDEGRLKLNGGRPQTEVPLNSKGVVHMDYFLSPSDPPTIPTDSVGGNLYEGETAAVRSSAPDPDEEPIEEIKEVVKDVPPPPSRSPTPTPSADFAEDAESQTPFTGLKGNESVDMKTEDVELTNNEADAGVEEAEKKSGTEVEGDCEGFGINVGRWRLTGFGALCSIGAAAATVCILVLGGNQRHKQQDQRQKLQFQIYADDKNIKEVVQHATRLNQVMSAARGVPMARANISFGGYYDGISS